MLAEKKVVRVGTVDAADLVDVAEALGDEERRARPGALEHRVDGDGRAVQEERRIGVGATRLRHALRDALDEMRGRGERFAEQKPAALRIEGGHIGERAADVGGKPRAT